MKTTTKLASYLLATAVMAVSPMTAFAAEGSGTNGLTFYDYLASNADKDTVINFRSAHYDQSYNPIGGLYTFQDSKKDTYPIYFYRGNVTNNNVLFDDICWLIIRTTETGGTKLLYNGKPTTSGQCMGNQYWTQEKIAQYPGYKANDISTWPINIIGGSSFNTKGSSPADLGYMYGERYEAEQKNLSNETYVFGNDVEYSNGQYTLKDTVSMTLPLTSSTYSEYTAVQNGHHYTCLNNSMSCSSVYYVVNQTYANAPAVITFSGGDTLESAKEKMVANINDSSIKQTIDAWYEKNMRGVQDYLEDTVWYGGKTFGSGALSSKDSDFSSQFDLNGTSYTADAIDTWYHGTTRTDQNIMPFIRSPENEDGIAPGILGNYDDIDTGDVSRIDLLPNTSLHYSPSFNYADENGKYTVSEENGNGALTYPVGMLTASEMMLSGYSFRDDIKNTYLDDRQNHIDWWSMSPFFFTTGASENIFWGQYVIWSEYGIGGEQKGVRPAVSLKVTVRALEGDGSGENPFRGLKTIEKESEEELISTEETTQAEAEATPDNPQTADIFLPTAVTIIALTSAAFVAVKRNTSR